MKDEFDLFFVTVGSHDANAELMQLNVDAQRMDRWTVSMSVIQVFHTAGFC